MLGRRGCARCHFAFSLIFISIGFLWVGMMKANRHVLHNYCSPQCACGCVLDNSISPWINCVSFSIRSLWNKAKIQSHRRIGDCRLVKPFSIFQCLFWHCDDNSVIIFRKSDFRSVFFYKWWNTVVHIHTDLSVGVRARPFLFRSHLNIHQSKHAINSFSIVFICVPPPKKL